MLSLEIILSFVIFCNKNVKKETFTKECLFFLCFISCSILSFQDNILCY